MRIAEHIVVQLVESDPPKVVVVNDLTSFELIVDGCDIRGILLGHWPSGDYGLAQMAHQVGEDNLDKLLEALAYFDQYI